MWEAMWNCHSWPLDVSSNVKLPCLTVRCQYGWEGISESEHFIWKFGSQCALDLTMGGISWPHWALHLKTWPNLPVCFEWALIDNMDQWRVRLMSLTVLWGGISWPSWAPYLKSWPNSAICFEWALIDNMDQRRVHLMSLDSRITYERPNDRWAK